MKIVGLTGGIGSGKSTVSMVFSTLGVPVFNSDQIARELLESNTEIRHKVKKLLGNDVYKNEHPNRKAIAAIVFSDSKKLDALNAIIHPAVKSTTEMRIAELEVTPRYCIKEAAILFESGADKDCDFVINVTSPESLRIQRVVERDGVSAEEVKARMANQWTESERAKQSDFSIDNDGSEAVITQVLSIHDILSAM